MYTTCLMMGGPYKHLALIQPLPTLSSARIKLRLELRLPGFVLCGPNMLIFIL